jgi:CubicO group peptidase (beta-lactamase class C family)
MLARSLFTLILLAGTSLAHADAAVGARAAGHPDAVTIDDRWHIGSDTKAFTATMIARLVERGVMRFEDTLGDSFPALASDMDPAYRSITVTQLLSHTAGLPPLTDDKDLPSFLALINAADGLKAQRAAIARKYLSMPPASPAGEYTYSNLGFIIAGAIAEARSGKTWENLIQEEIFAPLGILNAGFGAPGTSGQFDQPQGHRETAGQMTPLDAADTEADNPPALGPAGTMHIALKDWMLFAQDQLDGVPMILTHSGSNGFWLADVRIMPKHDMIILIAINAGNDAADQAVKEIGRPLRDRLKPFD